MTATIRRVAGAFGLIGVLVVLSAVPAAASGETIGTCVFEEILHAEEEFGSLHVLEEAGHKADLVKFEEDLEKCVEAPSPIIPELDEIIWGGAAFLILFGFMWWKGFPAVQRLCRLAPRRSRPTSTPLRRPRHKRPRFWPTMKHN